MLALKECRNTNTINALPFIRMKEHIHVPLIVSLSLVIFKINFN